jgi:hypothetical protein
VYNFIETLINQCFVEIIMIFNGGKTMKSKKFLTVIMVISILFGTILTGCKDKEEDNENKENKGGVYLTGKYGRQIQTSANDTLTFTETSFSATRYSQTLYSGTYKYDGAILTLTISGIKHNYYANRTSVLTISGDGAYSNFFNGTWTGKSW